MSKMLLCTGPSPFSLQSGKNTYQTLLIELVLHTKLMSIDYFSFLLFAMLIMQKSRLKEVGILRIIREGEGAK